MVKMVNIMCILLQSKSQKIFTKKFKVSLLQKFSESFICQNDFVNL